MTEPIDDRLTDGAQTATTDRESAAERDPPWSRRAADSDALALDTVFGLLQNERRRRVLTYLLTESSRCELGDLAEHLAARETDKPVELLTSAERKRTYVALYQCHVPRLDDAGVVDFDRGTVTLRDGAVQLAPYLGLGDGDEGRRAPRPAALVTGLGVALAAATVATSLVLTGHSVRPSAVAVAIGVPAVAAAAWASAFRLRVLSRRLRDVTLGSR